MESDKTKNTNKSIKSCSFGHTNTNSTTGANANTNEKQEKNKASKDPIYSERMVVDIQFPIPTTFSTVVGLLLCTKRVKFRKREEATGFMLKPASKSEFKSKIELALKPENPEPGPEPEPEIGHPTEEAEYGAKWCLDVNTDTSTEVDNSIQLIQNRNFENTVNFIDAVISGIEFPASVLAHTLVYVYRLTRRFPEFYTSSDNAGVKIFVSSLLLATKYCQDDAFLTVKYVAQRLCRSRNRSRSIRYSCIREPEPVPGTKFDIEFDIAMVNRMETAVLKILKYRLYVSQKEYKWAVLKGNLAK